MACIYNYSDELNEKGERIVNRVCQGIDERSVFLGRVENLPRRGFDGVARLVSGTTIDEPRKTGSNLCESELIHLWMDYEDDAYLAGVTILADTAD